jgi:vacuolar-type H+-ATPase subunit I/STV1
MRRGPAYQRLLALFIAGGLLFNFPLLRIFEVDALLFGLPLLPAALFIVWALLIAALAWLMERGSTED